MKLPPFIVRDCIGRTSLYTLLTAVAALSLGACRGMPSFVGGLAGAPSETLSAPDATAESGASAAPVVSASALQTHHKPVVQTETDAPTYEAPFDPRPAPSQQPGVIQEEPASYLEYGPAEAPPVRLGRAAPPALPWHTSPQFVQPVGHTEVIENGEVIANTDAGVERPHHAEFTPNVARVGHTARTLPPGAFTGQTHCCADPMYPPEVWRMRKDEFLCDGGDKSLEVRVNPDWTVRGLDPEDTVVHFDTLDGATEVEPSNCVCIYAPRFAAVRKTVGLSLARVRQRSAGVELPMMLVQQEDIDSAGTVNQPLQPGRNVGLDQLITLEDRNQGILLQGRNLASGLDNGFLLYENLLLIRRGQFDNSEKVRLANSIEAAVVWTDEQGVQVAVDGDQVFVQEGVLEPLEIDRYERQGKPRMRICKVASDKEAHPGDIIHFTLRFDNIGDQEVGNVTIVDNLVTRLEYVPDSAECSLDAQFFATQNEGESLVLRWEIAQPIKPGEGGIIRFQCRVR
ncbi:MAG: hypothetical protein RIC55_07100 [Pirellulaceae bacterium]